MRTRFQYKLLLSLIAVLIVTAGAISYVWYTFSRDMVTEALLESNERLLNERVREINGIFSALDYQSRILSVNNLIVERGLERDWQSSMLHAQTSRNLHNYLDSVYASSLSIRAIEIGNAEGIFYGRGIRRGFEYIRRQGIDARLEDSGSDLLILPYYDDGGQIREIMLIRNVIYYGKTIGYSLISISHDVLEDTFAGIFPSNTVIQVNNRFGERLYHAGSLSADPASGAIPDMPALQETGVQRITGNGKGEWLVIGRPAADGNLTLHVAVPLDEMLDSMRQKFGDIAMITLAMMGALLLIVLFVSRWIGRNISVLSRALRRFSEGNMVQTLNVHGRDEFAQVAVAFNEMTRSIRRLLEDIKAKEQEKMEMELRALQGQINLHFLFNTLNTIKNLAYIQRIANIERLVGSLMELLHASMADGKTFITLATEIQYVQHFVEIYKYKSIKPIALVIDIDPALKEAVIPKFTLQPIVENAIIHGIEADDEEKDGLIRIAARRERDDLILSVIDNGKGFDPPANRLFTGIGIANTDQRIKMQFGDRYGLTIGDEPDEPTTVTIRLPFRKELTP